MEEPNKAFDATRSTNNFIKDNLYVGPLQYEGGGFRQYDGGFDKKMWYDPKDENWDKLIEFVKNKTVVINGQELPVLEIIGYN